MTSLSPITFRILCQNPYNPSPASVRIRPPFGIVTLNQTCTAVSENIALPAHYTAQTTYRLKMTEELRNINITGSHIWKPVHDTHPNFTVPPGLEKLENIDMGQLIQELQNIKLNTHDKSTMTQLEYLGIPGGGIIVLVLVVACLCRKKLNKCCEPSTFCRNVKHSPKQDSKTEEIPMMPIQRHAIGPTSPLYPQLTTATGSAPNTEMGLQPSSTGQFQLSVNA